MPAQAHVRCDVSAARGWLFVPRLLVAGLFGPSCKGWGPLPALGDSAILQVRCLNTREEDRPGWCFLPQPRRHDGWQDHGGLCRCPPLLQEAARGWEVTLRPLWSGPGSAHPPSACLGPFQCSGWRAFPVTSEPVSPSVWHRHVPCGGMQVAEGTLAVSAELPAPPHTPRPCLPGGLRGLLTPGE